MKLISKGAEAEIYLHKNIIKKRISKGYRLKEIDDKLRKSRTKREAKIIQILPFKAPKIIATNFYEIEMSFVRGKMVKNILEENIDVCIQIGIKLALLHDRGIIHGDLTTSNMIYDDEIYFIDFGLGYFSDKIEDKAVDLHLLKQSLVSKHHSISAKAFNLVLKSYQPKDYTKIIKRLNVVESRGRNKTKT